MKRLITLGVCLLILFSLVSCKSKDPFEIYESYGGKCHQELTMHFYNANGTYAGKQYGDVYKEPGITYRVTDGFLGPYKQYFDDNDRLYEYNYTENKWYKKKSDSLDTNFDGWWDKDNYDYKNGIYTLKGYIDIGQQEYRLVYIDKSGFLVTEEKIIYDGFYVIEERKYIEGGKDYNLKFPEKYTTQYGNS